jgi:hypothetical protein
MTSITIYIFPEEPPKQIDHDNIIKMLGAMVAAKEYF